MSADTQLILGIVVAAAAGACIDGAVAFQAREAQQVSTRHALRPSLFLELFRRPMWVAATGAQALGAVLQVVALSLAPLTVVQPTLAMGLIVLLILTSARLHERVDATHWLAVAAIIGGVALLALVAPERTVGAPGTWEVVLVSAVLIAPMLAVRLVGTDRAGARGMILGAGTGIALAAIGAKLIADELDGGHWVHAIPYAVIAGVGVYGSQLIDMSALQRFGATQIAPPVFALEIVIPVALAPILFGETWSEPLLVILGLAIVVVAGWVISRAPAVVQAEEEEAAREAAERERSGAGGETQDDVGR